MSNLKVALVADWITHWGGAEQVFAKLMQMYPEADIYTSVFFPDRPEVFTGRKVHTSFIQHIPWLNRRHKLCMLLRPLAFSLFRFEGYDLVISASSAEAKGIHVRKKKEQEQEQEQGRNKYFFALAKKYLSNFSPLTKGGRGGLMQSSGINLSGTVHICYCHTPTRYLWSHSDEYKNNLEFGGLNWLAKLVIPLAFTIMRKWDFKAAQRPDIMFANSITTQERIAEYYHRESIVVYPFLSKIQSTKYKEQNETPNPKSQGPIKSQISNPNGKIENYEPFDGKLEQGGDEIVSTMNDKRLTINEGNYFVCLGRIVPYKRFDLAIEACNFLKLPLKIFTSTKNDELARLQVLSGPTIEWIFGASDMEVADALEQASGFIMPQEEDFGIVALEAMAHGIPVIAYGEGGATETVIHGETGLLFSEQTVESLVLAIERSETIEWNRDRIREQGYSFSEERFEEEFQKIIDNAIIDKR